MGKAVLSRKRIKNLTNFLFIVPLLIVNITFFVVPFIRTLYMSFYDWQLLGDRRFVGFENYVRAFADSKVISSLLFTGKYALMVTPMLFIVAMIMALLVNHKFKGVGVFRTIYFLPVVISMSASANMWLWIYNELYGVLNYILLN